MLRPPLLRQLYSPLRPLLGIPSKQPLHTPLNLPRPSQNPFSHQHHRQFHHSIPRPASFRRPTYNRFSRAQQISHLWQNDPRFRYGIAAVGGAGIGFYFYNIEEVPVTHRRRFNCMPPGFMEQDGARQQQMVLKQFSGRVLPASDPRVLLVAKVLNRLIPASGMKNAEWEVHVIDDPSIVNAFVIPGGKVFVFTGILPICATEDGIAAVLGHEIAHNVASHAAERASQAWILIGLAVLAAQLFDVSASVSNLVLELGISRPNSRKQESEADHIGLLMMAQSCYDPQAAVAMWQRMDKAQKGAPPAFLSTHPTSSSRAEAITEWMPEAEQKRQEGHCFETGGYLEEFRSATAFGGGRGRESVQPERPREREEEGFW